MGAHRAVLEGGEHAPQRRDLLVGRALGDQPRRHAFQRRPGGDQLDHLALGLAHHVDAAPRHRAHETLALELRHGLAHRRAADAELVRQPALVEPDLGAAAIDVHRGDGVLQRRIGLALEACRTGERIDGKPRRRQLCRARGSLGAPQYGETRTHRWHTIFQLGLASSKVSGSDPAAASIPYKCRPNGWADWANTPGIQPGDPARFIQRPARLSAFGHRPRPQRLEHEQRQAHDHEVHDRGDRRTPCASCRSTILIRLATGTRKADVPLAV